MSKKPKGAKSKTAAPRSKDLRSRPVSERDAARVKGGRRDKIATNHNQTLRIS
jgi:hypothetical protein